jgi:hypothetical protein
VDIRGHAVCEAPAATFKGWSFVISPDFWVALWENVLVQPDRGGGTDDGTHRYPYPRCPSPANPTFDVGYPSSNGQQIWFYDGGASYYEMADYFKDPIWHNCGTYIASNIMATAVTTPTQGYLYAYTRTLQRAWAVTQDPRYKVRSYACRTHAGAPIWDRYTTSVCGNSRFRSLGYSFAAALPACNSYFEVTIPVPSAVHGRGLRCVNLQITTESTMTSGFRW